MCETCRLEREKLARNLEKLTQNLDDTRAELAAVKTALRAFLLEIAYAPDFATFRTQVPRNMTIATGIKESF